MQIQSVPAASMAGMVCSILIAIVLPVVMCVVIHKKTRAGFAGFFVGCSVFMIFAMILEQALHAAVFAAAGEVLQKNVILYGLYGGLAAALFEESGRFLAMKFVMKDRLTKENALMYGAGHGGVEAFLILGIASVNNLALSVAANDGHLQTMLTDTLGESQGAAALEELSVLWTTPSYQFFLGGAERIMAMALQIFLSLLVYRAVKMGQKKYLAFALLFHFAVDFAAVVSAAYLPVWGVELLILALTAGVGYFTLRTVASMETEEQ